MSPRRVRQFVGFAAAGAVGFVVDVAVLYLLEGSLGLYGGRAGSFLAAAWVTWLINRRLAFGDRASAAGGAREFAAYLWFMAAGAATNLGTYAAMLQVLPAFGALPAIAVAAGSVAGLLLNFTAATWLLDHDGSYTGSRTRSRRG